MVDSVLVEKNHKYNPVVVTGYGVAEFVLLLHLHKNIGDGKFKLVKSYSKKLNRETFKVFLRGKENRKPHYTFIIYNYEDISLLWS